MENRYGSLDCVFVLEQTNSYDLGNKGLGTWQEKICLFSDSVKVSAMKSQRTHSKMELGAEKNCPLTQNRKQIMINRTRIKIDLRIASEMGILSLWQREHCNAEEQLQAIATIMPSSYYQ